MLKLKFVHDQMKVVETHTFDIVRFKRKPKTEQIYSCLRFINRRVTRLRTNTNQNQTAMLPILRVDTNIVLAQSPSHTMFMLNAKMKVQSYIYISIKNGNESRIPIVLKIVRVYGLKGKGK